MAEAEGRSFENPNQVSSAGARASALQIWFGRVFQIAPSTPSTPTAPRTHASLKIRISPHEKADATRTLYPPMKIREMMTKGTRSVSPETPVIEAAGLMRLHDIGVVPVLDGDR